MKSRHKTLLISALLVLIAGFVMWDAWLDHTVVLAEQDASIEMRRIENARLDLLIRATEGKR